MDAPTGTKYGTVVGKLSEFVGDGPDPDDLPDRNVVIGTVTFTPTIDYVVNANDPTEIIYLNPLPMKVMADGSFSVKLVANESPSLSPTGWTYDVRIEGNGKRVLAGGVKVVGGQLHRLGEIIDPAQAGPQVTVVRGEKGDPGPKGDPGRDGTDGRSPTVTMTGDQLAVDGTVVGPHLTGPQGERGPAGPASTVPGPAGADGKLGPTGPTGPAGPAGPKGDSAVTSSTVEIRGTGSPLGTVAPPAAGTYYTDTSGTNGAWRWVSTSTSGNSWVVVYGDTGRRNVSAYVVGLSSGNVYVRRVNNWVTVDADDAQWGNLTSGNPTIPLGGGFGPSPTYVGAMFAMGGSGGPTNPGLSRIDKVGGSLRFSDAGKNLWLRDTRTWSTQEPWPSTLPGTPV